MIGHSGRRRAILSREERRAESTVLDHLPMQKVESLDQA